MLTPNGAREAVKLLDELDETRKSLKYLTKTMKSVVSLEVRGEGFTSLEIDTLSEEFRGFLYCRLEVHLIARIETMERELAKTYGVSAAPSDRPTTVSFDDPNGAAKADEIYNKVRTSDGHEGHLCSQITRCAKKAGDWVRFQETAREGELMGYLIEPDLVSAVVMVAGQLLRVRPEDVISNS